MTYEEILMQCLPIVMNEYSKQYYKAIEGDNKHLIAPLDYLPVIANRSAQLAKCLLAEIDGHKETLKSTTAE